LTDEALEAAMHHLHGLKDPKDITDEFSKIELRGTRLTNITPFVLLWEKTLERMKEEVKAEMDSQLGKIFLRKIDDKDSNLASAIRL